MIKFLRIVLWITFIINFSNISLSKENFYADGVKLFETKKIKLDVLKSEKIIGIN